MQVRPREAQVASSSSTGEPEASEKSSPPQKKSVMAELFGALFTTEKGTTKSLSQITEEIMSYRLSGCIPADENPLAWWRNNEHKYPRIANCARHYLAVPGTSVPNERVFSTAGDIVTASRSRLLAENVDKLIFLQKNMIIE